MKRYGNLWDTLVSWPNLLLAARKARTGKRRRPVVARFELQREWHLLKLRDELQAEIYTPRPFTTHRITHPKPRLISAAPYRDRVVHHAIMNVLMPLMDQRLHPSCFACRQAKGTHAAARHVQIMAERNRYAWHADIRSFFPSIDHAILKQLVRRLIKDRRFLALLDRVIDYSNDQDPVEIYFPGDTLFTPMERRRGLPIGNLTSQWLANWYLNGMDHLITSHLRHGCYARSCDDCVVMGNCETQLRAVRRDVVAYLATLRLQLHPKKDMISPIRAGITFVGYRIWPSQIKVRRVTVRRFFKRLRWIRKHFETGALSRDEVRTRVHGFLGHVVPFQGVSIRMAIVRKWRAFAKTKTQTQSRANKTNK